MSIGMLLFVFCFITWQALILKGHLFSHAGTRAYTTAFINGKLNKVKERLPARNILRAGQSIHLL